MNADFLLTHWNRLIAAPGAVTEFRRVILDLAVRGLLTTDWRVASRNVEPAGELLARIKKSKLRLVAAKKLREEKPLPEISEAQMPFEVPSGWQWCRLLELCEKTGSGSTPSGGKSAYTAEGIPFLRSQNVHDNGLELGEVALISEAIHESMSGTKVRPNDLLLNITGGSIGRCAIVPSELVEANVSQHVAIIRPVEPKLTPYLHIEIRSTTFKNQTDDAQTGAGREGLPKNKMDLFPIPLPPLAEQAVIVERVEALMGLCDRLEAAQRERDAMRRRYLAAGYAQLAEPTDDTVSVNVSELLTRSVEAAQLKPLQQLILTLAIRGDLTADWRAAHPDVEPASQLLHRIQAEKARLIAAKKLRPEKPLPKITPAEIPFEIPKSWEWGRFGSYARFERGKFSARPRNDKRFFGGPYPFIQIGSLDNHGSVVTEAAQTLNDAGLAVSKMFEAGTIAVAIVGGTIGNLGVLGRDMCFTDSVVGVRPSKLTCQDFILLLMRSKQPEIQSVAYQRAGQPNISLPNLTDILIPLPPLAEQAAIVERVEALMTTCRLLEAEIEHARTHAAHLLQAVLKEAFAPAS